MLLYIRQGSDFMLKTSDILDEKDPIVRAHNTDVEFPLTDT